MRTVLATLLLGASPLAAQAPTARDTAEIRAAALRETPPEHGDSARARSQSAPSPR